MFELSPLKTNVQFKSDTNTKIEPDVEDLETLQKERTDSNDITNPIESKSKISTDKILMGVGTVAATAVAAYALIKNRKSSKELEKMAKKFKNSEKQKEELFQKIKDVEAETKKAIDEANEKIKNIKPRTKVIYTTPPGSRRYTGSTSGPTAGTGSTKGTSYWSRFKSWFKRKKTSTGSASGGTKTGGGATGSGSTSGPITGTGSTKGTSYWSRFKSWFKRKKPSTGSASGGTKTGGSATGSGSASGGTKTGGGTTGSGSASGGTKAGGSTTGAATGYKAWKTGENSYTDSFLKELESILNDVKAKTSHRLTYNMASLKTEVDRIAALFGINADGIKNGEKSLYKRMGLKYHPDRNQGDEVAEMIFKMFNELKILSGK